MILERKQFFIIIAIIGGIVGPLLLSTFYTYRLEIEARSKLQEKEMERIAGTLANGLVDPIWNLIPSSGYPLFNSVLSDPLVYRATVTSIAEGPFLSGVDSTIDPPLHRESVTREIVREGQKIGELTIVFNTSLREYQINQLWVKVLLALTFQIIATVAIFIALFRVFTRMERQKAIIESNELLRISEEKHRLAMEATQDGFWDWDYETGFADYSQGWFEILGLSEFEDDISAWSDRIHQEDYDEVMDSLQCHLQGESDFWRCEFRIKTGDSGYKWVLMRGRVVNRGQSGEALRMVGTLSDIGHRKKVEQKLNYQATHDSLTGLINRAEFERRVDRLINSTREQNSEHALCFLDLDQFKIVNDTCGHPAGDELLRQLGQMLRQVVRKRDTLGRLGGDEFALLMEHCDTEQAQRVAREILDKINEFQFVWEGNVHRLGASIGLVPVTSELVSVTELLKQADTACYMAKDLGRNRIHFFHPMDDSLVQRQGEMAWVSRINNALEEKRLCLYAQPIVSAHESEKVHYEILLRMLDSNGEVILPGAFLPAAERYNLMEILDSWVIKQAFSLLSSHPSFVSKIDFTSINLSASSLVNPGFLEFIVSQIKQLELETHKICFEITETTAISNLSIAISFIEQLKEMGCLFALDDFGSGLSSFGYLKNLPVDFVKIDGIFVKDILQDPIDFAMVKSINEIGHIMNKKTIAEFVESHEIRLKLESIGVDYLQGYYIGRPVPIIECLDFVEGSRSGAI